MHHGRIGVLLTLLVCACGPDEYIAADAGPEPCVVDDLFCNGVERMVDGACVKIPADPCDDFVDCTSDACDEATDTCTHDPVGSCATCSGGCEPECTGRECGDDGCGGLCGTCDAGQGCASGPGSCMNATAAGTCGSPRALTVTLGTQTISGSTANSLHQATPTCNNTSTAVEDVYSFTITTPTGIDARSSGYDTVLHLRTDCDDDTESATVACADDSAPPGDYGSRISALLPAGTYYLIVDGFDSSQLGPYDLEVTFVDDCVPQCDGKFCGGSDGCGGDCGTCGTGFTCEADFRCYPDTCVPNCTNSDSTARECGADGCYEGSCGTCTGDALCVDATGQCETFPECDHDNPTCGACDADEFCGTDCACHAFDEALPDLVIARDRLADEILFDTVTVDAASCAAVEECVSGLGDRRVLRFSVEAINQGLATLTVPDPTTRPDLFTFSPCHGHYHFSGFADYQLLDEDGNTVVMGRKQAYCMEDTQQVIEGPNVGCDKAFDCFNQGIQAGWSDLYGNALDCQWLDITDVAPGDYQLRVSINPNKSFEEVTLDNNTATVPVTIEAP